MKKYKTNLTKKVIISIAISLPIACFIYNSFLLNAFIGGIVSVIFDLYEENK